MTCGQSMQEACLAGPKRYVMHVEDELAKKVAATSQTAHAEYIQSVFSERPRLIETYDIHFATDINARRRDAEDSGFAEPSNREAGPYGQRGRQRGGHYYRDKIGCP